MSPWTIKRLFPNASKSILAANAADYGPSEPEETEVDNPRPTAKLERPAGHGSLATNQGQETGSERILVRFVSVRKRLLDPDNLCEKWHLDCLRYCRLIPGDEPQKIKLETDQRKAAKGEIEHTELEIIWP